MFHIFDHMSFIFVFALGNRTRERTFIALPHQSLDAKFELRSSDVLFLKVVIALGVSIWVRIFSFHSRSLDTWFWLCLRSLNFINSLAKSTLDWIQIFFCQICVLSLLLLCVFEIFRLEVFYHVLFAFNSVWACFCFSYTPAIQSCISTWPI